MKIKYLAFRAFSFMFILSLAACDFNKNKTDYTGWTDYAGTKDGARYSSLTQIDTSNVQLLKMVWELKTGESDSANKTQIQCNPIVVDSILYGATPRKNFFAADAATGKIKWLFKPSNFIADNTPWWAGTNRGVTFWKEGAEKRLFVTVGPFLFALNPNNGVPIESFGAGGKIDLHEGLDRDSIQNLFVTANTPGIIFKDKIILGMRVSEDADAAPGHIRAFNVRTGKREWIFHTVPRPDEFGSDSWEDPSAWQKIGGANCWAGMSLDEKRGIVFVPTGSTAPDFYGGSRLGHNLFANCLIALDANTGKRIWHFQTVHHDLWDRDLPANPNLVTIKKDGKTIEAVAQITKQGFVFLFDRMTGAPVFPIEERAVPSSTVLGEKAALTQPYPILPRPFARSIFEEKDINRLTTSPQEQAETAQKLAKIKKTNLFEPPTEGVPILIFPDYDGGGEWGGASFDPQTGVLYVNGSEQPSTLELAAVPDPKLLKINAKTPVNVGQSLYTTWCGNCHGTNRKGNTGGSIPNLIVSKTKMTIAQINEIIGKGRGMMPAFPALSADEKNAITYYIMDLPQPKAELKVKKEKPYVPFRMTGYNRLVTQNGLPAISPPWGTLTAIDLNTGEHLWRVPLGELDSLKKMGIPTTGLPQYGGSVVTAGGLVFIAATQDEKIRAFNKKTGKLLWEHPLPAAGYATPSVFSVGGKQFVVIACGGGKLGTKSGDSYVAFALP